MKVKVSELRKLVTEKLEQKGYTESDIPFIIDMFLGGELRGHVSHGLASLPAFLKKDFAHMTKPGILLKTASSTYIDAQANSGNVIGRELADVAITHAKNELIGFVLIRNMDSWLRPGALAEYIAKQGYIAYVSNSGGEASIAPPGGYDPVAGTNPIAYGIPTETEPLVVDIATSKHAKGQIRLANKYGTKLPEDSFYDDTGTITIEPSKAYSLLSFGEHKGFSLALLGEILCNSLVGMPMMIEGDPSNQSYGGITPKRGAYILVIDPSKTIGLDDFKHSNSQYLERIRATRPRTGEKIRIPGEQAAIKATAAITNDILEIPDELWDELQLL